MDRTVGGANTYASCEVSAGLLLGVTLPFGGCQRAERGLAADGGSPTQYPMSLSILYALLYFCFLITCSHIVKHWRGCPPTKRQRYTNSATSWDSLDRWCLWAKIDVSLG